jgi:glyceraldehyde 3-phosphate dehydrogenase
MFSVGINGFGRIGKLIFIQLLSNIKIKVSAINAPDLDINNIINYLKYDSVHKYDKQWDIKIINSENFEINGNLIHIFRNRNAKELDWKTFGINYVIDATGSYLSTAKCQDHNSDYVIMCAPPKDKSPLFIYMVNDEKYNGEKIVSNGSCTTNCITPVLKFLNDTYKIKSANFTTIHSTTASQTTVDIINSNNRTHRSILNNIIPHSTGASSSIAEVIPLLLGKVYGTSLRVPVSNVSLVDLNVELETPTTFEELMNELEKHEFIQVTSQNLVSSDFLTTTVPSIIDKKASMHIGGNSYKLMIWYDNEWSYSAQVIRLLEKMYEFNNRSITKPRILNHANFIDNFNFSNKNVILRVDWNIPTKDCKIVDDFRIRSSLDTIKRIQRDNPNRIIIISHFGRPEGRSNKYSWKPYLNEISKYFSEEIFFLEDGLSQSTLITLQNTNNKLYLLENVRFHNEETNYLDNMNSEPVNVIQQLGDFFVNDAFGCMHRNHLSICGINTVNKAFGYLVNKELDSLNILLENKQNYKILAIIGGAKVDDKLPLLNALSKKMNDIYIAGGNINGILKNNELREYVNNISNNKAKIHLMNDGFCAKNLEKDSQNLYCSNLEKLKEDYYLYDVGYNSILELSKLINDNDVIFWNGTLGVVEQDRYENGSNLLVNILINSKKKVIVGGGDTAGYVNRLKQKNIINNFYFISTGGGAVIEYISNNGLVGVDFITS